MRNCKELLWSSKLMMVSVICKDRELVSFAMHIICEGKAAIDVHHLGHWICHDPADQLVMPLTR